MGATENMHESQQAMQDLEDVEMGLPEGGCCDVYKRMYTYQHACQLLCTTGVDRAEVLDMVDFSGAGDEERGKTIEEPVTPQEHIRSHYTPGPDFQFRV